MKRPSFDEAEHQRMASRKSENGPHFDDLFARVLVAESNTPSWVLTWGTMTPAQQHAQRERWKELLRPRVIELARKSGPEGIIAADVISDGITSGVLWGERVFLKKYPRRYSWIGPWLGQLAGSGLLNQVMVALPNGSRMAVTRMSERSLSKHNKGQVYVLGVAA